MDSHPSETRRKLDAAISRFYPLCDNELLSECMPQVEQLLENLRNYVTMLGISELTQRAPKPVFEPGSGQANEQAKNANALDEAMGALIDHLKKTVKERDDSPSAVLEKKKRWEAVWAAVPAFMEFRALGSVFLAPQVKRYGKTSPDTMGIDDHKEEKFLPYERQRED